MQVTECRKHSINDVFPLSLPRYIPGSLMVLPYGTPPPLPWGNTAQVESKTYFRLIVYSERDDAVKTI